MNRRISEPHENLALHCQTDICKDASESSKVEPSGEGEVSGGGGGHGCEAHGSNESARDRSSSAAASCTSSSSNGSNPSNASSPQLSGARALGRGTVFDQKNAAYSGHFKYRAKRGRACIGGGADSSGQQAVIPGTQFVIGRRLGKPGGQGTVYEACDPNSKRQVAVKVSPNNAVSKLEVALMKRLSHRNILPVLDAQFGRCNMYTILEHCPGGDLYERLVKSPGAFFTRDVARRYFADIVAALSHCHRHGIAHRDVKLENLLLDAEDRVILADFGSACDIRSSAAASAGGIVGTKEYVAPEVLKLGSHQSPRGSIPVGIGHSVLRRGKNLDLFATDIWSLGVVLYAMMEGRLPFRQAQLPDSSFSALVHGKLRFPSHFPDPACNILHACFQIQPSRRTNILRIECHPWLKIMKDKVGD